MFLQEIAFLVPRTPAEVHKKPYGLSISLMFLKEIACLVPRTPAEVHKEILKQKNPGGGSNLIPYLKLENSPLARFGSKKKNRE